MEKGRSGGFLDVEVGDAGGAADFVEKLFVAKGREAGLDEGAEFGGTRSGVEDIFEAGFFVGEGEVGKEVVVFDDLGSVEFDVVEGDGGGGTAAVEGEGDFTARAVLDGEGAGGGKSAGEHGGP
jgi:hypothetical protein